MVIGSLLIASSHSFVDFNQATSGTPARDPQPLPRNQATLPKDKPITLTPILARAAFHPSDSCLLGYLNGANYGMDLPIDQGVTIGLGGWIIDRMNKDVPRLAWIILSREDGVDSYQAPITFWTSSPDVREAWGGAKGYARAGFISNIEIDHMPIGRYHVYVKYKVGSDFYTCDNGRYLTIESQI